MTQPRSIDPGRSADRRCARCMKPWGNHSEVIDAEVSAYFDTIPHRALLKCVAGGVSDRKLLHVISCG